MKKLKLAELSIKSFVTVQNSNKAKTIKSGSLTMASEYDSDGPPHTSSTTNAVATCESNEMESICNDTINPHPYVSKKS